MAKKQKYKRRSDGLLETTRTDKRTGKRIHFYGHTDSEINAQIMAYTGHQNRGRLFKEIAEEWKEIHFPELAPNTLRGYRPAYVRAVEAFGDDPIRKIQATDIKSFIKGFAKGGRAKKTVATQFLILNMICAYAVEKKDLEYSPCTYVSIPKNLPKRRRDAASLEDEERIKANYKSWLLPYLILYTGLRKGEALALTDKDIGKDYISVSKSVYYVNNTPYLKEPKTSAGNREIPILDPLRSKIPKRFTGYLFSEDGGKTPLTETQYQKLWRAYAKETGITCSAHQLRHSYATLLFECGIKVKDAQNLLGHSTAAMTQDVYTHLRNARMENTAKKLNEMIKEA